ncbi:hypothetical protein [Bifidobacterium sp.]|jgi:hypothetical protein|uniref:hypothetical protein n=1 Tax=Bifidobacterium sp. TaxID=41200 RepID=UPI0025C2442B|nr:hypothetical protein [Bifidobacterium sp.]MCH4209242.1 hypothetical protein [Bifidobacterium sp.]MCI1224647.1 hypothetical protein [Bifidobacterium sp.]
MSPSHIPRHGFDIDGILFSFCLVLQSCSEITGKQMIFSTMTACSVAANFGPSKQKERGIFSRIKIDMNLHSKLLQRTVSLAKAYRGQGCGVGIITAHR